MFTYHIIEEYQEQGGLSCGLEGPSRKIQYLRFSSQPIYVGIIIKPDLSELFIRFTCPYIAKGSTVKSTARKFKVDTVCYTVC